MNENTANIIKQAIIDHLNKNRSSSDEVMLTLDDLNVEIHTVTRTPSDLDNEGAAYFGMTNIVGEAEQAKFIAIAPDGDIEAITYEFDGRYSLITLNNQEG